MRGSFEVAPSPRFCFLGFLPSRLPLLLLLLRSRPFSLPRAPRQPRARPSVSPFGIRLFHGGSLRVSRPSFLRPFLASPHCSMQDLLVPPIAASGPYVPHSCGIAPGWASFYNLVRASWGGTDLRRCSPTPTTMGIPRATLATRFAFRCM